MNHIIQTLRAKMGITQFILSSPWGSFFLRQQIPQQTSSLDGSAGMQGSRDILFMLLSFPFSAIIPSPCPFSFASQQYQLSLSNLRSRDDGISFPKDFEKSKGDLLLLLTFNKAEYTLSSSRSVAGFSFSLLFVKEVLASLISSLQFTRHFLGVEQQNYSYFLVRSSPISLGVGLTLYLSRPRHLEMSIVLVMLGLCRQKLLKFLSVTGPLSSEMKLFRGRERFIDSPLMCLEELGYLDDLVKLEA